MPRSGGDSGKLGNRYEGWWTVHNLIDVLAGDAVALQPESYEEALGVEFIKTLRDNSEEFHSVKRQRDGAGWTLNALSRLDNRGRSVLKDLFDKLKLGASRKVVFVSTTVHSQAYDVWDRAQRCKTTEEYERQLKTDKSLHEDFTNYFLPLCENDLGEALKRLHLLRLTSIDEYTLRRLVAVNIRRLVYRTDNEPIDAEALVLKLADFICDSLGRKLTEQDVRSELARHGYHLCDWARDSHTSGKVQALNQRYLRHIEAELVLPPQGIPRPEALNLAQALQEKDSKLARLVVGAAGFGKSCVLAQTIHELQKADVPVLAIRLDNVQRVNSTRDLGQSQGLHESPAIVLAGLSQGRRAVLLVDQLDAMSVVSGRNPELWQTFEELILEVAQHPNLRLLLACRAFDLEHDPRLQRLTKDEGPAQKFNLELLPAETVNQVVRRGGGLPERLAKNEIEILRIPFHLYLFLQGEPSNPIPFGGRQELFARFWKSKRRKANERNVDFERVVGMLTDELSQSESISAPESRLDSVASDAEVLVSDNVLVLENKRYRFFHESFFDYAFARQFVNKRRDLVSFLTEECTEQHLFRRAQVRQVLAYKRDDNRDEYLATLLELLDHSKVRIHLKKLALDWLAQLDDPCEGEWRIVERLLKHPQLHWAAFNVLWGKLPWFDLLDKLNVLPHLLSQSDVGFVDRCVRGLGQDEILKQRSAKVAALLRPYKQKGDDWIRRFKGIFHFGHFHHSQEMFDFVSELIREGLFDDGDEFRWHSLNEMTDQRPDFAVELLAMALERMIYSASKRGETNPFIEQDSNKQIEPRFISSVSQKAPEQFAERIVPFVKQLVLVNAKPADCGGYYDEVWWHIWGGIDCEHTTKDALLGATHRALAEVARLNPQKCDALLDGWEKLNHKTLQFLLICAWGENPTYFAERAALHFGSCQLAFTVSYDMTSGGIESRCALPLLKAISPLVSLETHLNLEAAIYGYITPYEKSQRKYRGYYELTLWQQLQTDRISKKGRTRVAELEAKFPERGITSAKKLRNVQMVEDGFMPPPISPTELSKMTDKRLVKLLQKYSSKGKSGRNRSRGNSTREIFTPLNHAAKADRKRFAALILNLREDISAVHFDAILWGLVDNSREVVKGGPDGQTDVEVPNDPLLPADILLQVVQRVHRLPGKPCGRTICKIADTIADRSVPVELIEIVADYALNDPNPETEVWDEDAGSDGKYYGGDPLSAGINSVRGSAADSFSRFLFAHKEMADRLLPYVEALAKDKSVAVRAVNIRALMALLNTHRDKAVGLFLEISRAGDHLWASRPTQDFLYYATFSHYTNLRPLLLQMLGSKLKEARHAASRQITLAAFKHQEAEEDMRQVMSGDEECRRGAAEIYAHNIHNESVRVKCASRLEVLFDDPIKQVRDTAARWFHRRNGPWLEWQRSVLKKYIESAAYADGDMECQMSLKETPEKLPSETLRLAERSVELYQEELKKSAPDPFRFSHYMPSLTVRYYEQSKDEETRRMCLDHLDCMIAFGWGEASRELEKADRW